MKNLMRLVREEEGQGMVEYILIIAAIAAVCIVAFQLIGSNADTKLTSVAGDIS